MPFEFHVESVRILLSTMACSEHVSMVAKTETFVNWFRSSCDFQDWEDSHGESKKILQQVLLPHEIVANFLAIGEVHRMIGREVPCQNVCFAILAFSNDMFAIDISWYPTCQCFQRRPTQGLEKILGTGESRNVVPTAPHPFRNMLTIFVL